MTTSTDTTAAHRPERDHPDPSAGDRRPVRARGPVVSAGLLSAAVGATGGWWLADTDRYLDHLRPGSETGSLFSLVGPATGSALLLAVGILGVLLAATMAIRGNTRATVGLATAYGVAAGLLLTDLTLLVTFGYGTAILGPPALLCYLVVAAVRAPAIRLPLAAAVAAVAGGAVAIGADGAAAGDFVEGLGSGLRDAGPGMLANLTAAVLAGLWVAVAVRNLPDGWWWGSRPLAAYSAPRRDWAWWVTLVAAVCPLPYALVRMTWLTPWPAFTADVDLDADPALRIFALSLGVAAISGSVLTLGLLARWGTTYPRWMPVVGGRVVSPTWPTALALVVGLALTVAGRSTTTMLISGTDTVLADLLVYVLLPFPVWGPALIIAALAYHRRRHGS